jgi:UV DNA damage endonuclease
MRDLEYHNEMLSLLKLPEQQNKDAIMILHMGGMFGDKEATLQRFRENYARLSDSIKARLVLENDDVCWHVHDLLPICEELNIPMVLDYHHHNIMFDKEKIREGTKDIMELYPRIKATWDRKGITQKMHYSEPCPEAITARQRRKHRPRVMTLPPCANDMDLMIEAKDKEQAVFELMRTYKLPGWDSFNDIVPYERDDENKPPPKQKTPKKKRNGKAGTDKDGDADMADSVVDAAPEIPPEVPSDEIGMGGPQRRVYWPIGMEEWLRPKKREVKKPAGESKKPKKSKVKNEDEEDE